MQQQRVRFTAVVLIATLAGCGGSGGSSVPSPSTPVAAAGTTNASATATIIIPGKHGTSSGRRAQYVPASTQSITLSVTRTDGLADFTAASLTPSSANCAALPSGGRQCVVPFSAPPTTGTQTDTVVASLVGDPDVNSGLNLATGTAVMSNVTVGTANTVSLVLGGIIGTQPTWGSPSAETPGTPSQVTVAVGPAYDEAGDVIGPTDLLDSPLQITLSGPNYTLVSPANGLLTTPGTVTLQYNGQTGGTDTLSLATTSLSSALYHNLGNPTAFTASLTLPY